MPTPRMVRSPTDSIFPMTRSTSLRPTRHGSREQGAVDSIEPPSWVQPPGAGRSPGPTCVVAIPQPFHVPAEGIVEYQQFVVDPGFRGSPECP